MSNTDIMDKALCLLEKQAKDNLNSLVAASKIDDPKARLTVLQNIEQNIERQRQAVKELKAA